MFSVAETGEQRPMATGDQLVVGGELRSGVVVSVHCRGGSSHGTNLRWEINGTRGDLEVTASSGRIQLSELVLREGRDADGGLQTLAVPDRYRFTPPDFSGGAVNVGEAYMQFAKGEHAAYPVPCFDQAVATHRLPDAIERSAQAGECIRF